MTKRSIFKKATNSLVGRVLRRLLGEEKGQALMEYILLGLLIAAVAVVAIGAFGNAESGLFGVLTHVVRGAPTDAQAKLAQVDSDATNDITASDENRGKVLGDSKFTKTSDTPTVKRVK